MAENLFKYNRKTMRYEPVGNRWGLLAVRGFLLAAGSCVSFFAIDYGYTHIRSSRTTTQLVAENKTMSRYQDQLLAEVSGMQADLEKLEAAGADIYESIYLTDRTTEIQPAPIADEKELDHSEFQTIAGNSNEKARIATQEARLANSGFARLFWPDKSDAGELSSIPAFTPIANLNAEMLACGFGNQINPFFKKAYHHPGLDILAETGEPVVAAGSGRILSVRHDDTPGGSGTSIVIQHGLGYQSSYSRLAEAKVRPGQWVRFGQEIAVVGISGSSIAPHLHYEVTRYGKHMNPAGLFVGSMSGKTFEDFLRSSLQMRKALD